MLLYKLIVPASFVVLLAACPQETAIWVAPASTVDRLEFLLGKQVGNMKPISISGLRVDPCHGNAGGMPDSTSMWTIDAMLGTEGKVSAIRYGTVPVGFTESIGPRDLERPGCYEVTISGTGFVRFTISEDGTVREVLTADGM